MLAARDAEIVAGLRRRLTHADAVTLTNFAWFADRRGARAAARDALVRALSLANVPATTQRTLDRLDADRDATLLLTSRDLPTDPPEEIPSLPAVADEEHGLLDRGRELLAAGRLTDALITFDRFLATHPADAPARFHRGVVLAKLRRYHEALHEWESVGTADPDGALGAISRRHARSARELATLFSAR